MSEEEKKEIDEDFIFERDYVSGTSGMEMPPE
jgi:hypothetical protein